MCFVDFTSLRQSDATLGGFSSTSIRKNSMAVVRLIVVIVFGVLNAVNGQDAGAAWAAIQGSNCIHYQKVLESYAKSYRFFRWWRGYGLFANRSEGMWRTL